MRQCIKSSVAARVLTPLLAWVVLTGCGQKGPLYLPPPQPAPQSKAPPAAEPVARPDRPFPDVPATNEKK